MKTLILKTTSDGSHTLLVSELNEHYHSTNGALQESEQVYIHNGLHSVALCINPVNILEIGFGTGLNALLTVIEAKKTRRKINYVAIEPEPLEVELVKSLNYPEIINTSEATGYFNKLHSAGWDYPSYLCDYFILSKIKAKLQDVKLRNEQFHLIYFDAFGPDVQPELWTEDIFTEMYNCLVSGGVLVTYSCKGNVKRALKSAGFTIEKLPGPIGKREVIRARKPGNCNKS